MTGIYHQWTACFTFLLLVALLTLTLLLRFDVCFLSALLVLGGGLAELIVGLKPRGGRLAEVTDLEAALSSDQRKRQYMYNIKKIRISIL